MQERAVIGAAGSQQYVTIGKEVQPPRWQCAVNANVDNAGTLRFGDNTAT